MLAKASVQLTHAVKNFRLVNYAYVTPLQDCFKSPASQLVPLPGVDQIRTIPAGAPGSLAYLREITGFLHQKIGGGVNSNRIRIAAEITDVSIRIGSCCHNFSLMISCQLKFTANRINMIGAVADNTRYQRWSATRLPVSYFLHVFPECAAPGRRHIVSAASPPQSVQA